MAEFRTTQGLVVGLVAKPDVPDKDEHKTVTPADSPEKKRNTQQKV